MSRLQTQIIHAALEKYYAVMLLPSMLRNRVRHFMMTIVKTRYDKNKNKTTRV